MPGTSLPIRLSLLTAILLTLLMIGVAVFSYKPLLALHGSNILIAEVVSLLLIYCVVMTWPSGPRSLLLRPQFATILGAVGGLVQVIHLAVERFCSFTQLWNGLVTLAFMLATFVLWGYAGYRAGSAGLSLSASCRIAIWSAIVTMTIAVTAGTLLEYLLAPVPLAVISQWAEFKRSGWNDVKAFSIANTMDAASSHLLIGPIVASIFGALGYALARMIRPATHQALSD
jgi:hypothetical protein